MKLEPIKRQRLIVSFIMTTLTLTSGISLQVRAATDEADTTYYTQNVVITSSAMTDPLLTSTNPQKPRQPVPAADGGGYLKNVTGFTLVRKGGISGDPLLRSLGGSRLNVLINGGSLYGGCPGRMDPSVTYAFPETFSRINIIKGPQSVRYGANLAGTVIFERDTKRFTSAGIRGNIGMLGGSNHRFDNLFDITAGNEKGYARFIQTRNYSRDYRDGGGQTVHSRYDRHSLTGIIGITPDKNTLFELSYDKSRGKAAFAHGMMDGRQFDRDSWALKFRRNLVSPYIAGIDIDIYRTTIDHIMDNYSLRPVPPRKMPMGTDVKRTLYGIRTVFDLVFSDTSLGAIGFDYQKQDHFFAVAPEGKPVGAFSKDMSIRNYGVFAEYSHFFSKQDSFHSGLRYDRVINDYLPYIGRNMSGKKTLDLLPGNTSFNGYSGFLRYEHKNRKKPLTFYIGLGHAERPADYWESFTSWKAKSNRLNPQGTAVSPSTGLLSPEKNTQLDIGWIYAGKKDRGSISFFYSDIRDFIMRTPQTYINTDARLYGLEADYTHHFTPHWTLSATAALTRGSDRRQHAPLPQLAPFETDVSLKYRHSAWEAGLLWRIVASQKRCRPGYGSETGVDTAPTGGFGIVSLNAAYKATDAMTFSCGIDNIFNKNYAEFVSYKEATISNLGIIGHEHINEPGRTVWFKANYRF